MSRNREDRNKRWRKTRAFFIRFALVGGGIILYNLISNDWHLTEERRNYYLLFALILVAFYLMAKVMNLLIDWLGTIEDKK